MRRRWTAVVVAVTILAIVLLTVIVLARRSSPVPVPEVLARFRASPGIAADGPPAAGVYRYSVVGDETGGVGPLRVSRDLPRQATLTVTRTPEGWETETIFSAQHIEGARLQVVADAIRMVWRREDVVFAGIGRDDRRDLRGVYRIAPIDPVRGARYSDRYVAGTLTNDVVTVVRRFDVVRVVDRRLRVAVISSTTTTRGALSGTREEVLWWSPDLRIPVKVDQRVKIDGMFRYESRLTMRLLDVVPAT